MGSLVGNSLVSANVYDSAPADDGRVEILNADPHD
jgi:hypothetical protein